MKQSYLLLIFTVFILFIGCKKNDSVTNLDGDSITNEDPSQNGSSEDLDNDSNQGSALNTGCLTTNLSLINDLLDNSSFGDRPGDYPFESAELLEPGLNEINQALEDLNQGKSLSQIQIDETCSNAESSIEDFYNSRSEFEPLSAELEIDGLDDGYIDFGESSQYGLATSKGFTLETWMKYDEDGLKNGTIQSLLSTFHTRQEGETQFAGWTLNFLNGNVRFTMGLEEEPSVKDDNLWETGASAPMDFGTWHHIATVYDPSSVHLKIYLDGQLVAEVSSPGDEIDILPNEDTRMFGFTTPENKGGGAMSGFIRNFRIWETPKTEADLRDLMNSEVDGIEDDLLCAWDFDETVEDENNIVDKTGNFIAKIVGSHKWHEN